MKSLSIVLSVLLLTAPCVAAYTSGQQTILEGIRLSFQLGMAYERASQGQNVAEFNALVDQYNTWIGQNFGEDPNLLMSKMDTSAISSLSSAAVPQNLLTGVVPRRPFNSSSDLSKFGKGQVYNQISSNEQNIAEANAADWILNNF